jgi:hypothetical protein
MNDSCGEKDRGSHHCMFIKVLTVVTEENVAYIFRKEHRLRLFENRSLRRIFGPKMHKVIREWRKLNNEELNDLYCPPLIFRAIKSRRMRWAEHVARMEKKCIQGFGGERDYLEVAGLDGRIILGWIFGMWDVGVWTGSSWLKIRSGGRHL